MPVTRWHTHGAGNNAEKRRRHVDSQEQVTSEVSATSAPDNQAVVRPVQTPAPTYLSRPSFDALDINHDGSISEVEAAAYPLLANDYLHVARKGSRGVTRAEYERW